MIDTAQFQCLGAVSKAGAGEEAERVLGAGVGG